ncbi:putative cell wall-binding protein [Catenulispora sp. GAS73]|uniref:cell wall-binding repeat-containing protein n=1 Tax=Catenulispora sp. GAS73 TaxID=3156269 RepID=UPI003517839F
MGNQNNHSVARKRLSTLAITTTLAAVGVGVVGAGAANAASTPAHNAGGNSNPQTSVKTSVALKVTADAKTGKGTVDLTGTTIDSSANFANAKVSINWGDKSLPDVTSITVDSTTGALSSQTASHTYADLTKDYAVTVTIVDGVNNPGLSKSGEVNFVADPVLKATLTPSTTKKNTSVSVSLTGSTVDPAATKAVTTISWGDKTADGSIPGDPSTIKASNPALWHSFAADGTYTVTVKLDDGLGDPNSVQTQTFTATVSDGTVVLRAAGDDRYGTGLAISQHQWANTGVTTDTRTQAKSVVLATGDDFADALVGVPLAKKAQGPLLLTDGNANVVNPAVLKEIQRVLPTKGTTVYILGGDKAVSVDIEAQIQKAGYTTTRLAGADRFATSLKIAQVGMGDPAHLVVARGDEGNNHDGFADALAAGPYAADVWGGGNSAVVLTNFNKFDPNTEAYVQSKLHAGVQNVAAIGGQAVAAMTTIKGSAGTFAPSFGATRYETAAQVAAAFETKAKNAPVGVATGLLFPDALTGGAYMASTNGPLLLTDPSALSSATAAELTDVAKTVPQINIFGGEKAVTPAVAKAIATLVNVTTIGKF